MGWIAVAATLASLLWLAPAFAGSVPDFDGDGVADQLDNCSVAVNTRQDDTDFDYCGNLCDADYDNDGHVGFSDFGELLRCWGWCCEEMRHREPVTDCIVSFSDFGFMVANFGGTPGPSGTTPGTIACP